MIETAGISASGLLFPLGRTVATPDALDALDLAGVLPQTLLDRHARGARAARTCAPSFLRRRE